MTQRVDDVCAPQGSLLESLECGCQWRLSVLRPADIDLGTLSNGCLSQYRPPLLLWLIHSTLLSAAFKLALAGRLHTIPQIGSRARARHSSTRTVSTYGHDAAEG